MEEIWKKFKDYDYYVSDLGNVKSKTSTLKSCANKKGYLTVCLYKKGERKKTFYVHNMVAICFLNHLPDGTNKIVIDHIDNKKTNNKLNNLQLITNKENVIKSIKTKKLCYN